MALRQILTRIASELGYSITQDSEYDFLVTKLNEIGVKLYQSKDLKGCLWEVTVNLGLANDGPLFSSLVSLPYFVGKLRGIRYSNIVGGKVAINDMSPRYHYGKGWGANAFMLPYRMINADCPTKRDVINASTVTITVPIAQSGDIVITISGKTDISHSTSEAITLTAGATSVESASNFEEIYSISKSVATDVDITVTDADGNELAVIPNTRFQSLYCVLEINDANASIAANVTPAGLLTALDVLYKKRYQLFVNIDDEYVVPNCDNALFNLFAAWYNSNTPGMEARTMGFIQAAEQEISDILVDEETGESLEIQFCPNGLLTAQRPYYEQQSYGTRWLIR